MLNLLSICAAAGIGLVVMSAVASGQGQPPQQPAAPPQYSADLKVGDKAPAFSLPGSDGRIHKLSDYKGKTVVIAWFPKAFTVG